MTTRLKTIRPKKTRAKKALIAATICGLAALVMTGCGNGSSSDSASPTPNGHAVVLVSGLATQTPYTTPTQACKQGLAAGNSLTALRASLLSDGNQVFTAPAQTGTTQVTSTTGLGASSDCPTPLPATMTINTTTGIDAGGESLTRFLTYLNQTYHIDTVDFVGHSMGGLFATAATKDVKAQNLPITIRSLTTLGTPWTGAYPADYAAGKLKMSACFNQPTCVQTLTDYKKLAQAQGAKGAASAISSLALQGKNGWTTQLGDTFKDIPVTLIGGNRFVHPGGSPQVWPNDSVVALNSALASTLNDQAIPHRSCLSRPDVHTTGIAAALQLPWTYSITWDPQVMTAVNNAVKDADNAMSTPNRQGCP